MEVSRNTVNALSVLLWRQQASIFAGWFLDDSIAMNEAQRQAYLKVMGIQTYFPKSALVGAKQSPVYAIPRQELDKPSLYGVNAGESKKSNSISPKQQRRSARDLSSQGEQGKPAGGIKGSGRRTVKDSAIMKPGSADGSQQSEALAVNIPAEEENELRFKLRYFKINEQLAVIDEVPHQRSEQANTEYSALLQAILTALGLEITAIDFKSESFSWPLAENLEMKNDPAEEAKRALSGFIQMRQETDGFNNLLVFAAQVDNLLVKQENGIDIRDFAVTSPSYFVTVTSSLHSMLAYPALKRDVWQQLQPLKKRLAESS